MAEKIPQHTSAAVFFVFNSGLCLFTHIGEAVTAVDRTLALWLEWHFGLLAARGAGGSKILTGATGGRFATVSAGLTTLGLILEATLCVELLLAGCKYELFATLFARDIFVFVHGYSSL